MEKSAALAELTEKNEKKPCVVYWKITVFYWIHFSKRRTPCAMTCVRACVDVSGDRVCGHSRCSPEVEDEKKRINCIPFPCPNGCRTRPRRVCSPKKEEKKKWKSHSLGRTSIPWSIYRRKYTRVRVSMRIAITIHNSAKMKNKRDRENEVKRKTANKHNGCDVIVFVSRRWQPSPTKTKYQQWNGIHDSYMKDFPRPEWGREKKNAGNNNERVQRHRRRNRRTKLNNHVQVHALHTRVFSFCFVKMPLRRSTFPPPSLRSVRAPCCFVSVIIVRLFSPLFRFLWFFFSLGCRRCRVCYSVTIGQSHTHAFAHISHYLKQKGSSEK